MQSSDYCPDDSVQVLKPHLKIQTIKRGEEEITIRRYEFETIPNEWQ